MILDFLIAAVFMQLIGQMDHPARDVVPQDLASSGADRDTEVPVDFHGQWAASLDECGVGHEGSLTISADRVDFHASRGRVLSVVAVGPREIEVEIRATGEGRTWVAVRRFVLSEDGRTLTDVTNRRSPFSRVRCGPPPANSEPPA